MVGRGTSTDDGFGIAAAVLATLLQENKSTVLCATHFHELTTFFQSHHDGHEAHNIGTAAVDVTNNNADTVCITANDEDLLKHDKPNTESTPAGVMNMHASAHVDAEKNSVTMLYEILPGPAHHSYGIHVAQAANFPSSIIQQAQLIESQLLSFCK